MVQARNMLMNHSEEWACNKSGKGVEKVKNRKRKDRILHGFSSLQFTDFVPETKTDTREV